MALAVGHLTVLADYLIIATGNTALQVKALTGHVEEGMAEQGVEPAGWRALAICAGW